jgi:beta-barrel assembly-enhancing protease
MKKKSYYLPVSVFLATVLVSLSLIYSCGANIFSTADDVEFGEELDKEIRNNPKEYPLLKNRPDITDYVSGIGKYIVNTSPKIEYKKIFPYKFQVINDTIVNAFCTPGGFIYVYTGLLKFADNEATVAGVVAHEIAHAERRHMTQRLTSIYGLNVLFSIVLGSNPNQVAEIFANLFVGLGLLANSRSDEEEADNYSIKYLMTSKYYPGAIQFFFDKILAEQKQKGTVGGELDRLLSTHPLPQDRIDNVKIQLKKNKIQPDPNKGIYYDEYQVFKAKLNFK